MLVSLCRRLLARGPVSPVVKTARRLPCRPRLEALEDRTLPATWLGGLAAAPGSAAPQLVGSAAYASTGPVQVTVTQNTAETVIDLGTVFRATSGLRHGSGLKLSVLGNTNAGLVRTDLSESALTLSYARGRCGTATITVGATDADGVSARRTLVVTVRPPLATTPFPTAGTAKAPPAPVIIPVSLRPSSPR
jgi:hypothetical protein